MTEQTTHHIAFECRDCGQRIVALGLSAVPADRRCATCRHLVETVPDEGEREVLRKRLQGA